MMKKILMMVTLLAVALIGADAVSANHYQNTQPRAPTYDGYARTGGAFPSMSFYKVGLRGGIANVPTQDYGMRYAISSYYYPRESIYAHSNRYYGNSYYGRPARVGGSFSYHGLRGVRPNTYGDFVFGSRYGGYGSGSIFS